MPRNKYKASDGDIDSLERYFYDFTSARSLWDIVKQRSLIQEMPQCERRRLLNEQWQKNFAYFYRQHYQ